MTWNLITVAFGDKKYRQGQRFLTKQAKECDVNHIEYSDQDLFKSELYKEYPKWMSPKIIMVGLHGNHILFFMLWKN